MKTNRWREAAVRFGEHLAARQLERPDGPRGRLRRVSARRLSEQQLVALLAVAFEAGAEHAEALLNHRPRPR